MKRLRNAIAPLVVAAALLSACGGSKTAGPLPPTASATAKKPNGAATFTIRYPSNLVRARASSRRSPRFIDPYGSPIIQITSHDLYGGYSDIADSQVCYAAAPGPDGTQQVTVPVFSDGGSVEIREYQSGVINSDLTCSGSGILAQSWNPNPGYSYSNTQVPYNGFTPGTDVYALTPTPTPSPNPSASPTVAPSPTASPGGPIFSTALTLQPVVSEIIFSSYYKSSYTTYNALAYDSTVDISSQVSPCGSDNLQFFAADLNGVSVGAIASTASPSPSPSPTTSPSAPAAYSGFIPVVFSKFQSTGTASAVPGTTAGLVTLNAGSGTMQFTVTAYDVFGKSIYDTVQITPTAC